MKKKIKAATEKKNKSEKEKNDVKNKLPDKVIELYDFIIKNAASDEQKENAKSEKEIYEKLLHGKQNSRVRAAATALARELKKS